MTPRFSVWLMPPPAVHDRFGRLIDTLSRRLRTPRFEPHITLAGTRDELSEEDAVERASVLASRLAPVPVRLLDVGYSDAYFRCLYVRAEPSAALLAAHRVASEHLGSTPAQDFMPHLSLVYGDLSRQDKERLIADIGRRFDTEFAAGALTLCLPAGAPDGWRMRGPFPLAGK